MFVYPKYIPDGKRNFINERQSYQAKSYFFISQDSEKC